MGFKASNNEAEYEARIIGLKRAGLMEVKRLHVYNDSQLIFKQVTSEYQMKEANMIFYLAKAKEKLKKFEEWFITQILRAEKVNADSLARLVSAS